MSQQVKRGWLPELDELFQIGDCRFQNGRMENAERRMLGIWDGQPSDGRRRTIATLIVGPKLFTVGEESPCRRSPQPNVNNFAVHATGLCEQLCRRLERPAVTPRWMTNKQPVSSDELAQSFAPARRLDSKRILRCRYFNVSL